MQKYEKEVLEIIWNLWSWKMVVAVVCRFVSICSKTQCIFIHYQRWKILFVYWFIQLQRAPFHYFMNSICFCNNTQQAEESIKWKFDIVSMPHNIHRTKVRPIRTEKYCWRREMELLLLLILLLSEVKRQTIKTFICMVNSKRNNECVPDQYRNHFAIQLTTLFNNVLTNGSNSCCLRKTVCASPNLSVT